MTFDEMLALFRAQGGQPPAPSVGTDWGALLPGGGQAQMPVGVGGNYQQVQNAGQGGAFSSVGSTQQGQVGASGQTMTGTTNQTGTTTNTGVSTDQTTGQDVSQTTGTQQDRAVDTLGFGRLLQGQAGQVGSSDAARSAFLTDTMQTGDSALGSQVDQAIRNSLTGAQVGGAGDSARARMGGYAAAEIGRRNMDQRLQAAGQLAGPTGLATLSSAANPYIGRDTNTQGTMVNNINRTNVGTTSGTQNTTGSTSQAQNTAGWQGLISQGNETQAGSTVGASSQAGSGNIPQGAPVKTGGCVLCTAAIGLGLWRNNRILRRVIGYKLGPGWKSFRLAARGYFAVFGPFADYLLDHPKLARFLYPLAKKVVYEELRVSGRSLPFRLDAWMVHWIGDLFCRLVGLFPVKGHVTQKRILDLAGQNNILFEVKS